MLLPHSSTTDKDYGTNRSAKAKDTSYQKDNEQPVIDELGKLIMALKTIDLTSPIAALNETTITDGNGGRVEL